VAWNANDWNAEVSFQERLLYGEEPGVQAEDTSIDFFILDRWINGSESPEGMSHDHEVIEI